MPVFYFHLQNGVLITDHDGIELADVTAAQAEATGTIAAVLREDDMNALWDGAPLRLWVTETPDHAAKALLELQVFAAAAGNVVALRGLTVRPKWRPIAV